MEDRADPVVARRSDSVKPLRVAWNHKARMYRVDTNHLGSEGYLLAWQGRVVVPYYAGPEASDLASILDRDGTVVKTIEVPPGTRVRAPTGPVVTWPDEGLVAGVHAERFQLIWIDLDGTSQTVATDLHARALASRPSFQLTPATDGAVIVSAATALASFEKLGWTIDLRLDSIYETVRRAPFEDCEYVSECRTRTARRWDAPGRVACVADDVAIMEEGSGIARYIVARRVSDGAECWRREAIDQFVLGTLPMPAWSDDRVYVLDRGARREQAWARETETAALHGIAADQPMRTILSVRAVARARDEQRITAPSVLRCLSTRTGEVLWHAAVDGDVVSFYGHARWVACVVAGERSALRVWRHDGTAISDAPTQALEPSGSAQWPPDAARWPCVAWGDDEHVLVAQNRAKGHGGPRLYHATIECPDVALWETPLPAPCVSVPGFRHLRLLNRVPMAFTNDAAFLRWGKQVYGLLP